MTLEKGRTHVYISRKIITDHGWPFGPRERVMLTLDPKRRRLVIERLPSGPADRETRGMSRRATGAKVGV